MRKGQIPWKKFLYLKQLLNANLWKRKKKLKKKNKRKTNKQTNKHKNNTKTKTKKQNKTKQNKNKKPSTCQCSENYGSPTCVTISKVAINIADPIIHQSHGKRFVPLCYDYKYTINTKRRKKKENALQLKRIRKNIETEETERVVNVD